MNDVKNVMNIMNVMNICRTIGKPPRRQRILWHIYRIYVGDIRTYLGALHINVLTFVEHVIAGRFYVAYVVN